MEWSDGEAAGRDPAAEADAPPIQPAEPSGSTLGSPVPAADILDNIDPKLAEETRRQQANLDRRLADQDLLKLLAVDNFAGPRYRRFEEELARYGISVLRGWMHSGYIFKLAASRGFNLSPTDREMEELVRDSDAREELANMTTALALARFRKQALVGAGWRVDGGASLPTYFMGSCLYVFPNEFRKRRLQQQKYVRGLRAEGILLEPVADQRCDPATIALGNIRVREDLDGLDPRTAAVVAASLIGYCQEEIAKLLNLASARAVEGILYRWRNKAKTRSRGGDIDGRAR